MFGYIESKEQFAKEFKNNHAKFNSFSWSRGRELENPENWGIFYTKNRDSEILAESNHDYIKEKFKPFIEDGTVLEEYHTHWAVGYTEGFAVMVYNDLGYFTEAFNTLWEIVEEFNAYPVLNEDDYNEREYTKCIGYIKEHLTYELGEELAGALAHDIYNRMVDAGEDYSYESLSDSSIIEHAKELLENAPKFVNRYTDFGNPELDLDTLDTIINILTNPELYSELEKNRLIDSLRELQ